MPQDDRETRVGVIKREYGNSQAARQFWIDVYTAAVTGGVGTRQASVIADTAMQYWAERWQ